MDLLLASPVWLYAAPFVALVALVSWRSSPVIVPPRGKRLMGGLRTLALLLLCCALADPKVLGRDEGVGGRKLVILVDASASIPDAERARAADAVRRLVEGPCRSTGVTPKTFAFAGEVAAAPVPTAVEEAVREVAASVGSSDLSLALRRAVAEAGEGDQVRVVLISDGRPTAGDLEPVLETLKLRGIPVSTVPLAARAPDGLLVEGFTVPEQVFVLERFPVEVLLRSAQAGQVRLRLFRDETQVANEVLEVGAGTTRWEYQSSEEAVGRHRYRVAVEPLTVPDGFEENNVQVAAVQAETVPRILVVADDEAAVAPFTTALDAAGVKHKVILERDFPHGLPSLLQYSAVVFSNVAADELRETQLDMLRRYVEEFGGGFMMLGGRKSFGPGGYQDTPVETILPVHMTPQSYSSSFGLILLLDSSSSMSGFPIQWTKRAAKQIIWLMRGRYLGIYYFSTLPGIAVRLQRIGTNRILVEQDIDTIQANGGTSFSPALQLARKHLDAQSFSSKNVIMLSDGQPSDFQDVQNLYPLMKSSGIKVSTIGIGTRVNNFVLREIAEKCGGRFYESQEVHKIPEIFEKEVKRIVGPPYVEERFRPVPDVRSRLVQGFPQGSLPTLHGYVGTTPKERSQVALLSERGDVVLAHWRFGLGRTAAFTSDVAADGWGRDWAAWSERTKFWGRVVKSILRVHASDYDLNVAVKDRRATLTVDAVDVRGVYVNGARLVTAVTDPDGKPLIELRLEQSGEGRYVGAFELPRKGFYEVVVRRLDGEPPPEPVATGMVALGYSPEYRFPATNRALLEHVAAVTGGRFAEAPDQVGDDLAEAAREVDVSRAWDLWPLLLLLGLVALTADITVRRLELWGSAAAETATDAHGTQALAYKRIADQYLAIAKELDRKGDERQAQEYYMKAHAFFLKAQYNDQAATMLERYRFLDQKRGG